VIGQPIVGEVLIQNKRGMEKKDWIMMITGTGDLLINRVDSS
jgi:predicted CDP-diglyceride synthetase/phosphatidate cytidylyltransferase